MIAFLHTSPVHVSTFDSLLDELSTGEEAQHVVDESLLAQALETGLTAALQERVNEYIALLINQGATQIVCTCSTIGGLAERAPVSAEVAVMRVDRPLVELAVTQGERILVFATVTSTLEPTRQLLVDTAAARQRDVAVEMILCEGAWALFEGGDQEGYLQTIAQTVRQHAQRGDVAVLAQASMAAAAELCHDVAIPILSSPRTAVQYLLKRSGTL